MEPWVISTSLIFTYLLATIVIGVGEVWHFDHALAAIGLGPLPDARLAALAKVMQSAAQEPESEALRMRAARCLAGLGALAWISAWIRRRVTARQQPAS